MYLCCDNLSFNEGRVGNGITIVVIQIKTSVAAALLSLSNFIAISHSGFEGFNSRDPPNLSSIFRPSKQCQTL